MAFEKAHEAAREAVLSQEDYFATVGEGKVVVDAWETANGEQDMDAVDGGTTATVIALLDGCKIVMAQVGDSSALLGGTVEGEEGEEGGEVTFRGAHGGALGNKRKEYERVLASGPRGKLLRFVYDVDDDDQPPIFKQRNTKPGAPPPVPKYELNEASRLRAVELETPPKNCRGDLPTILLTPKKDVTYPKLEPITLAMTRSIGDFYLHTFGVTWKPEVRTVELSDLIMKKSGGGKGGKLTNLTLILASDGIWDLYENSEVFEAIVSKPTVLSNGKRKQSISNAKAFFDKSVEKGAEIFGSSADNMTGIVVYLNPDRHGGGRQGAASNHTAEVRDSGRPASDHTDEEGERQAEDARNPRIAADAKGWRGRSEADGRRGRARGGCGRLRVLNFTVCE